MEASAETVAELKRQLTEKGTEFADGPAHLRQDAHKDAPQQRREGVRIGRRVLEPVLWRRQLYVRGGIVHACVEGQLVGRPAREGERGGRLGLADVAPLRDGDGLVRGGTVRLPDEEGGHVLELWEVVFVPVRRGPRVGEDVRQRRFRELLDTEPGFLAACLSELFSRQTEDERATRDSVHQNAMGFSAFDARRGSELAEACAAGKELEGADRRDALQVVLKHRAQLGG